MCSQKWKGEAGSNKSTPATESASPSNNDCLKSITFSAESSECGVAFEVDTDEDEEPLEPTLHKYNSQTVVKGLSCSIKKGWSTIDDLIKKDISCQYDKKNTIKTTKSSVEALNDYYKLGFDGNRQRFIKTLISKRVLPQEILKKPCYQNSKNV